MYNIFFAVNETVPKSVYVIGPDLNFSSCFGEGKLQHKSATTAAIDGGQSSTFQP